MIGTVITIAAAAMDPVGSSNWEAPVNVAIAAGAVMERSVAVSEIANRMARTTAPTATIPATQIATPRAPASTVRTTCPR